MFPWRLLLLAGVLCTLIGVALAPRLAERSTSLVPPVGIAGQKSLGSLPLAAQGPLSAAVGRDRAAFRVSSLGIETFTANATGASLRARGR